MQFSPIKIKNYVLVAYIPDYSIENGQNKKVVKKEYIIHAIPKKIFFFFFFAQQY